MPPSTQGLTALLPQSSDPSELRRSSTGIVMALDRSLQTHQATAQRLHALEQAIAKLNAKQEETLSAVRELAGGRSTDKAVGARTWLILIGGLTVIQAIVGVALKVLL